MIHPGQMDLSWELLSNSLFHSSWLRSGFLSCLNSFPMDGHPGKQWWPELSLPVFFSQWGNYCCSGYYLIAVWKRFMALPLLPFCSCYLFSILPLFSISGPVSLKCGLNYITNPFNLQNMQRNLNGRRCINKIFSWPVLFWLKLHFYTYPLACFFLLSGLIDCFCHGS